jgi:hypothetical protein
MEAHASWRQDPVVVGVEVRRLRTRYGVSPSDAGATHFNLAMGFEF